MRANVYIILLSLFVLGMGLSSCKKFKETRAETQASQQHRKDSIAQLRAAEERAEALASQPPTPEAAPVAPIQMQADSLLLQFERRPCFGRCPIYKIKVYESGYTIYEGVNFVKYMGRYHTRLPQMDVAKIYTMLAEVDFFNLEDSYDDHMIMDLASMIFKANAMGQYKKIVARYEVPESLIQMGLDIDALFAETDWKNLIED